MDNNNNNISKELMISRIEPYMEKFTKFFKLGYIRLTAAETKEVEELTRYINPKFKMHSNINCNSCIRTAVTSLSNYYSREIKNVSNNNPETVELEPTNTVTNTEDCKPCKDKEKGIVETEEETVYDFTKESPEYYDSLDKRTTLYKEWVKYKNSLS